PGCGAVPHPSCACSRPVRQSRRPGVYGSAPGENTAAAGGRMQPQLSGCPSSSSGRWPAAAESSKGRPEDSPAWFASAEASLTSPRACRSASAGACKDVSGRSTANPSSVREYSPPPDSSEPPPVPVPPTPEPPDPGPPPGMNAEVIDCSAAVNSVGMTHSLEELPFAICGSICRYW